MSADLRAHVPANADAVLWVPELGKFTTQLMSFARGIQEAAIFRDALKPETGVDLGEIDGLRRAGINPEAGLALVWRDGLIYVLVGVEDEETLSTALRAKFENLGYSVQSPASQTVSGLYLVIRSDGEEHAAYQSKTGVMVLAYRVTGESPSTALQPLLTEARAGFFESTRYSELKKRLGDDGLMFYLDGEAARSNESDSGWSHFVAMSPPVIGPLLVTQFKQWLAHVQFFASRVVLSSCDALTKFTVVSDPTAPPLIPDAWALSPQVSVPNMVDVLPRDTVLFTRMEFNAAPLGALITRLAGLTGGLKGLLGAGDSVGELLGKYVHPELKDRHILRDIVDQITGHVGVALLGIDRAAPVSDLIDFSVPQRWFNQAQLVFAVEVRDGDKFWSRWVTKLALLESFGYRVDVRSDVDAASVDDLISISRMCSRQERRTARRQRRGNRVQMPPCEKYSVLRRKNVLWITTGAETLERVLAGIQGQAATLPGLSREPLATAVLATEHVSLGGYFSFDGLLKAVENRNLPGGATRYLAQMFEFVFRLNTNGSYLDLDLLLTR